MTSPRAYRRTPLSEEAAVAELRAEAGTQFDPEIVEAFLSVLTDRRRGPREVALLRPSPC
jgi:HD-GYP domain-containing protein (c-di-GMP phosphodiesterase class II)